MGQEVDRMSRYSCLADAAGHHGPTMKQTLVVVLVEGRGSRFG